MTLPTPSPPVPATPAPTSTTAAPAAPPSGEPLSWLRTDRSLTDPWLAEALRHMPPDSTHHEAGHALWQERLRVAVLAAADQALATQAAEAMLATAGAANPVHHAPTAGATKATKAVGAVGAAGALGPVGAATAAGATGGPSAGPAHGSTQTSGTWKARQRRRIGWGVWVGLCGALMAAAGVLWLRLGP